MISPEGLASMFNRSNMSNLSVIELIKIIDYAFFIPEPFLTNHPIPLISQRLLNESIQMEKAAYLNPSAAFCLIS